MIGQNDFARQWRETREDAMAAFDEFGAGAWYILGREVECFEQSLGQYWGAPYAVGVASGLDAIEISLRVLGCQAGDKVLTTPLSAFATTLAIVKLGAIPVFADVDAYGLIDLAAAADAIRRDGGIRYFVPVHLYGHALNVSTLTRIQAEFGIAIVEDCAQSIGACFNGAPTGSAGKLAATSFYPTKNLGAMGDGGAILTADEGYARTARMLRDYGQSAKYRHDAIGYNSRLDGLQAALLRKVYMPRLNRWIARRREIAEAYLQAIRNPLIQVPGAPPGSQSCWHLFPLLVEPERKASFIAHMRRQAIGVGEHYPMLIPDQKGLSGRPFEISRSGIAQARRFSASQVSLPIHPFLTAAEVSEVVEAVNGWIV